MNILAFHVLVKVWLILGENRVKVRNHVNIQGIEISDKYIEIIIIKMTNMMKVLNLVIQNTSLVISSTLMITLI
jgi:hypothetical protein